MTESKSFTFERGKPHPLGATVTPAGANFSVFSERATGMELLLFDRHDDLEPVAVLALDPDVNRTFHIWHAYVRGATPGMHYAFRVQGPEPPRPPTSSTRRRFSSSLTPAA